MEVRVSCEEFINRLTNLCVESGLSCLTRKERDRHILLKSMILPLKADCTYTEKQVDDVIKSWLANVGKSLDTDHVNLRRLLVDHRYLNRDKAGSRYCIYENGPWRKMFEQDVNKVNVFDVIREAEERIALRKRSYLKNIIRFQCKRDCIDQPHEYRVLP